MTTPNMQIMVPVNFPANVVGNGGIVVNKAAGVWTVQPDFTQLAAIGAVTDPGAKEVWIFDPSSGIYNVMTLNNVATSMFSATSITSLLVASGTKVFATQTNKYFPIGSYVQAVSSGTPTSYMYGVVTAYANGSLTLSVTSIGVVNTLADWTLLFSGVPGPQGSPGAGTLAGMATHGIPVASGAAAVGSSIALTNGQLIVGQTGADPQGLTITGDVTLNASGATAIGAGKVFASMIANLAVDNTKFAQMGAWTIKGNPTSALANVADMTPANFAAFLASSNNSAPRITLANTGATSPTIPGPLGGISGLMTITASDSSLLGNAIVGFTIQDRVNADFPTGVTGGALITASGSTAFGGFFPAILTAAHGWPIGIETDCYNASGTDAVWPLVGGLPISWVNGTGIQAVSNGPNKTTHAFRAVATGANWLASFYADPPPSAGNLYGIYIDANSSFGPLQSAVLRNTGAGQHLTMQTMAAQVPGNIVMQHIDMNAVVAFELFQSGSITTGNSVSNPGGITNLQINNANAGAGSAAWVQAVSNAGGFSMRALAVADGSTAFVRWTGAGGMFIDQFNAAGSVTIRTGAGPTIAMTISSAQAIAFPGVGTTASAANAFLDNAASNNLLRSTSSIRYKRDVQDIDAARAAAVMGLRPVWYRSTAENDRADWSWYGLIAEEVAAVDPRLVHWSYLPTDWDEEEILERMGGGKKRALRAGAQLVPDSVMYDRVAVLLLDVTQRHEKRLQQLETTH